MASTLTGNETGQAGSSSTRSSKRRIKGNGRTIYPEEGKVVIDLLKGTQSQASGLRADLWSIR